MSPGAWEGFGGSKRLIRSSICPLSSCSSSCMLLFYSGRDCGAASVAVVTNEFLMPPAVNSWIWNNHEQRLFRPPASAFGNEDAFLFGEAEAVRRNGLVLMTAATCAACWSRGCFQLWLWTRSAAGWDIPQPLCAPQSHVLGEWVTPALPFGLVWHLLDIHCHESTIRCRGKSLFVYEIHVSHSLKLQGMHDPYTGMDWEL